MYEKRKHFSHQCIAQKIKIFDDDKVSHIANVA